MTVLTQISETQAQKATTANENFTSVAAAGLFGRNGVTTTGLTWGYWGGQLYVDGTATTINDGTVALTGASTNYVEATRAGTVSANTTAFTAGRIPLYTVVTGASTITSYTDAREFYGRLYEASISVSMTSADVTLSAVQARAEIIYVSGTLSGATRKLIVPAVPWSYIIYNNTSGSFYVTSATPGSPDVSVLLATGMRTIVYCDGTNVYSALNNMITNVANTQVMYSSSGAIVGSANLTTDGTTLTAHTLTVSTGALTVSGAGPHAIGGATNATSHFSLGTGTTFSGSNPLGFDDRLSLTTTTASVAYKMVLANAGTVTLNTGGAVTTVATLALHEPNIVVSSGSLTNSATLYISGVATEATNNYALWVDAGAVQFDGTLGVTGATTLSSTLTVSNSSVAPIVFESSNAAPVINNRTTATANASNTILTYYSLKDSGGTDTIFVYTQALSSTITDTAEVGTYHIATQAAGELSNSLSIVGRAVTIPGALGVTGIITATAGVYIGAAAAANQIDDASNGAGSTTLYIGNAAITVTSDERLKRNMKPLADGLSIIKALAPIEYDQDEGRPFGDVGHYAGFGARHSHKVAPWSVNTQGDTGLPWQMRQEFLMAPVVRAIQQLTEKVAALEARQ